MGEIPASMARGEGGDRSHWSESWKTVWSRQSAGSRRGKFVIVREESVGREREMNGYVGVKTPLARLIIPPPRENRKAVVPLREQ